MRTSSQHIWDLWNAGGPAVGENGAVHGRVTVEPDWFLTLGGVSASASGNWSGLDLDVLAGETVLSVATDGGRFIWITLAGLSFYRYDLLNSTYEQLPDKLYTTTSSTLVYDVAGSFIWSFGEDPALGAVSGITRYDINAETWEDLTSVLPDVQSVRTRAAYGVRDGKVIFAGGYGTSGITDSVMEYDLSADIWTELAPLDAPLAEANGVWIGSQFYVFGGWDGASFTPLGRHYNASTDQWNNLAAPAFDSNSAGAPVVVLGEGHNTILVIAGDGTVATNHTWVYEANTGVWTRLPGAPISGYAHGVTTSDGVYLYAEVGGTQSAIFTETAIPRSLRTDIRWWQRADNSQEETEVPNVDAIEIDRSVDQDAGTCRITLSNQWHLDNGEVQPGTDLGQPGFFSFSRGESVDAQTRWGQATNEWNEIIVPDALLRTYQGYGGKSKSIPDAEADGNIILTGVWLVDSVRINARSGKIEISCRDMGKLLIEQQIYPPLMPSSLYPLMYSRWGFRDLSSAQTLLLAAAPAFFGDTQTTPLVVSGVTNYSGAVPQPDFPDYEGNEPGNGYWILMTDGHLYAFGNNHSHGQILVDYTTNPAMKIEPSITGKGYWVIYRVGTRGAVVGFGDAPNYGSSTLDDVLSFARTWKGDGYWSLNVWGVVSGNGNAPWHGNCPTAADPADFWSSIIATDICADPVGDGYWVLTNVGRVYAFGSAVHHGDANGAIWAGNGLPIKTFGRMRAHPSGGGYWIIDQIGDVHAYGTAKHYGQLAGQAYTALGGNLPFQNPDFPDYMPDLIPTPSGNGYWILGVSGGVYSFGDANLLGALNGPYEAHLRINGNYTDYVDIIKQFALWAGFWLYPETEPDGTPSVYGNVETTGAFASDRLDETIFDKQPVIDPMTKLKEIVGYLIWIDDEGAFHFETPNIFSPGNLDEFGEFTATIPEIDEAIQLTDYAVDYADKSARSEIIISTTDPTENLTDTITTRYTPSTAEILRGMIKPAMWVNGVFTIKHEQEIMAELIGLYIWLAQRQGSVSCMANPQIQINDQVRIWERVTSETYIHYVRGVASSMDLVAGNYSMTLTTHWMGDGSVWAVDLGRVPFAFEGIATPATLEYSFATDDLGGSRSDTELATDGNLATSWSPGGGNRQIISTAIEYIEYDVTGDIDTVGIYAFGASHAYISIDEGAGWVGGSPITYDPISSPGEFNGYSPSINRVAHVALTDEGPTVVDLGSTYNATKLRITLHGFDRSNWGPQYYIGGIREVAAGLA